MQQAFGACEYEDGKLQRNGIGALGHRRDSKSTASTMATFCIIFPFVSCITRHTSAFKLKAWRILRLDSSYNRLLVRYPLAILAATVVTRHAAKARKSTGAGTTLAMLGFGRISAGRRS